MSDQRSNSEGLRYFCRHLVALCGSYHLARQESSEAPAFFAYAGTAICINDSYYFLTAGHILENLVKALDRGDLSLHACVLADTFGLEAKTDKPIPFDLRNAPKLYLYEDGLDFGLIGLSPYYVRLLEATGIKAIFRQNWEHQHTVHFDGYAMLGLPEEFTSSNVSFSDGEVLVHGTVAPTIITLSRLSQPPGDVSPTKYPCFVGQIDPSLEIGSIVGMSGGPVFGFSLGPPIRYWIVAVQSSWLPQRRITFGCPVPVLGELLQELFNAVGGGTDT